MDAHFQNEDVVQLFLNKENRKSKFKKRFKYFEESYLWNNIILRCFIFEIQVHELLKVMRSSNSIIPLSLEPCFLMWKAKDTDVIDIYIYIYIYLTLLCSISIYIIYIFIFLYIHIYGYIYMVKYISIYKYIWLYIYI